MPDDLPASPAQALQQTAPLNALATVLRRRVPGVALGFAVVVLLAFAALAWLVPHLLATTAPNWLKEKTGRELRVRDATFNPFTLRLNVNDVVLNDGGKPLAAVARIEAKGSWATLINFAWTADSITLTKPEINARIASDGSLDWVRFLDSLPKSTEPPSDSVPRILLRNLGIENASIRLADDRAVRRTSREPRGMDARSSHRRRVQRSVWTAVRSRWRTPRRGLLSTSARR